ncbi:hypothetical protein E1B28_012625 [Marasmius oreades]|uniref:Uncharacterized protein n=1 Tax=Marasmius oreades TaxID=181124 RepID=A0A9P7UNW4_9AGAR|nr:uncharacterized protein E1B28_012625 [Marasmius oreades]KAG7088653.1 hypothetical protein E1B28_012625 [Marasmius oreades]
MLKKSQKSLLSSSIYSLVLVLFVVTASAARSSNENSHARRSLDRKRQPGLAGFVDGNLVQRDDGSLIDELGSLLGIDTTSLLGPTSIVPSSTSSSVTSSARSDSTSSSSSSSISSSSSASSSVTSSSSPSSTSSGDILDTLTSIILGNPPSTSDTSSSTTASDTIGTTTGTDTNPGTPTQTDVTTSTTPVTTPPPTESATSTTSSDGGILSSILSGLSSVVDPPTTVETTTESTSPTSEPTTSDSTITDPPSSSATPTSSDGGILSTLITDLSSVLDPPSSSATPTSSDGGILSSILDPTSSSATPTSSDGGILSTVITDISSVLNPPTSSSAFSSTITNPPSSSISDSASSSLPITDPPASSSSSGSSSSFSDSSIPSGSSGPSSNSSAPSSTVSPSISFPSGNVSISATTTSSSVNTSSTTSQPPISVESDLSFVLTQSQLAFSSVPTTTRTQSLSDPDQATTTLSSTTPAASATFTEAPLPPDLPSRIYPSDPVASGTNVTGYTTFVMLFDQLLSWPFVVDDPYSSSQIFALMPAIINTALGLTEGRQQQTSYLQAYKRMDYHGPQDASSLGTQYWGKLPTEEIANLAAMVQAPKSPFYNAVNNQVARQLAEHVDKGFSVVAQPNSNGGDGGKTSEGSESGNTSSDRTRQDAIIGVVSALGGIAILVLAFLVYRWYQRRKEQQHRRLSDPPGSRPMGRDFDQDSVGGQRRRSFYFAEDSLRGFQDAQQSDQVDAFGYHASQSAPGMSQRRNIVPGAISQPILRESSMNW